MEDEKEADVEGETTSCGVLQVDGLYYMHPNPKHPKKGKGQFTPQMLFEGGCLWNSGASIDERDARCFEDPRGRPEVHTHPAPAILVLHTVTDDTQRVDA